jgi:hypothetical protein
LEKITPFGMFRGTAGADTVGEMLVHTVGHQELCIFRPAVESFGGLDLSLAQRVAAFSVSRLCGAPAEMTR